MDLREVVDRLGIAAVGIVSNGVAAGEHRAYYE
jgi:hypothetical protein